MKRAQAANETAIIIAFMTLFLTVFLAAVSEKLVVATDERTKELAEDLSDVIESELTIASNAQEGYERIFSLPSLLDGKDYTPWFYAKSELKTGLDPENTDTADYTMATLTIEVGGGNYNTVRLLPENIVGNLEKQDNFVRKRRGIAELNLPVVLYQIYEPTSDITIAASGRFTLVGSASCTGSPLKSCDGVSIEARVSGGPVPPGGTPGAKFTTPSANPQSCGNLDYGQSCTKSWSITAAGSPGEFEDFVVHTPLPGPLDSSSASRRVTIT